MENEEKITPAEQYEIDESAVQRSKELFEYEMTEVRLKLAGRFKKITSEDMNNAGNDVEIKASTLTPLEIDEEIEKPLFAVSEVKGVDASSMKIAEMGEPAVSAEFPESKALSCDECAKPNVGISAPILPEHEASRAEQKPVEIKVEITPPEIGEDKNIDCGIPGADVGVDKVEISCRSSLSSLDSQLDDPRNGIGIAPILPKKLVEASVVSDERVCIRVESIPTVGIKPAEKKEIVISKPAIDKIEEKKLSPVCIAHESVEITAGGDNSVKCGGIDYSSAETEVEIGCKVSVKESGLSVVEMEAVAPSVSCGFVNEKGSNPEFAPVGVEVEVTPEAFPEVKTLSRGITEPINVSVTHAESVESRSIASVEISDIEVGATASVNVKTATAEYSPAAIEVSVNSTPTASVKMLDFDPDMPEVSVDSKQIKTASISSSDIVEQMRKIAESTHAPKGLTYGEMCERCPVEMPTFDYKSAFDSIAKAIMTENGRK